jgi:predicted DNA-binding transcriptional regulator YafY
MRADRLVMALLVLQAKGRVTAGTLAAELEVSVKTARRDLEALARAGLPVYAQPGRGGGWSLVGGARTDLSGLSAAEARALFLLAGPGASVAPEARAALRKLVRALPETFRADAQAAASALLLDASRWGGAAPPSQPHLDSLQQAVIERRQVRLGYVDRRRHESTRTVHPLGLVRKGSAWYLVAGTDEGQRTFQVARIRSVAVLEERADRPEGFDLARSWAATVVAVEQTRRRVRALVRVPAYAIGPLRERWGTDLTVLSETGDRHVLVELAAALPEMIAEQLAGWGAQVDVIGPDVVREHLARIGAELAGRYGPAAPPARPRPSAVATT